MGWERGRYYTRSIKVNGRVVREYIGAGLVGELAARQDARKREERRQATVARQQVKAELAAIETQAKAVIEATKLAAGAALLAAGFHQHKGGEWRKRRGSKAVAG